MQGIRRQLSRWVWRRRRQGFTLVELLVVVGIIVALASVVAPNVARFASKGEEGSRAAEMSSVQTAMDAMMVDRGIASVTPQVGPELSVNDFGAEPPEGPLSQYLRQSPTRFFYCWNGKGLITAQHRTAATCP